MRVPILKQGSFLIATVQDAVTDKDLRELQDELARRIGAHRSKGVVIDVTLLDVIDSFATRTLRNIAGTVRLRGAELVVGGIQPDVAFAMVQLGLDLEATKTALDLEEGLALLGGGVA